MSDDLIARLEAMQADYVGTRAGWIIREAAAEIRSLREQVAQERAAIAAMRAERAGVVARVRLEGAEVMREAAAVEAWSKMNDHRNVCSCADCVSGAIRNLNPAAILEARARAKATGTLGDSDGDDGA